MTDEPTAFDPNAYWLGRGEGYIHERRLSGVFYLQQEEFIRDVVQALNPTSILEIACGYGRITKVLADALPECQITAMDLSPEQIANAKLHCPSPNVEFRVGDVFTMDLPAADLVITIEFFLHRTSEEVSAIIAKILTSSPKLIHDIDADPNLLPSDHCFVHDYPALYAAAGAQVACQHRRYKQEQQVVLMVVERA